MRFIASVIGSGGDGEDDSSIREALRQSREAFYGANPSRVGETSSSATCDPVAPLASIPPSSGIADGEDFSEALCHISPSPSLSGATMNKGSSAGVSNVHIPKSKPEL